MRQIHLFVLAALASTAIAMARPSQGAASAYHIYRGSTHAHTSDTWSHGDQWTPGADTKMAVEDGVSHPGPLNVLRPDWEDHQGPPAKHFALAKANGYDFYIVTDHSQEVAYQPVSATNPAWRAARKAATDATTSTFVALTGYEHSENNGPGGQGHLNVINSAEYLNALAPGIDLPYFYKWLTTTPADGDGPVVASFNHPDPDQYGNWADRDARVTDILTMLEVINSNDKIHDAGFVNALDKGWKVSPVAGNDNHGLGGITRQKSRTFLLATSLTKLGLLDAMLHRRTYASLDTNIQCRYTVNGAIMGSTLNRPDVLQFDISIADPDAANPKDFITKIDIVKDAGVVEETYTGAPAASVHWTPTVRDGTSHYFFVRVWSAGGGDAPTPDPSKPIAWLAPVWTGR